MKDPFETPNPEPNSDQDQVSARTKLESESSESKENLTALEREASDSFKKFTELTLEAKKRWEDVKSEISTIPDEQLRSRLEGVLLVFDQAGSGGLSDLGSIVDKLDQQKGDPEIDKLAEVCRGQIDELSTMLLDLKQELSEKTDQELRVWVNDRQRGFEERLNALNKAADFHTNHITAPSDYAEWGRGTHQETAELITGIMEDLKQVDDLSGVSSAELSEGLGEAFPKLSEDDPKALDTPPYRAFKTPERGRNVKEEVNLNRLINRLASQEDEEGREAVLEEIQAIMGGTELESDDPETERIMDLFNRIEEAKKRGEMDEARRLEEEIKNPFKADTKEDQIVDLMEKLIKAEQRGDTEEAEAIEERLERLRGELGSDS